MSVKKTISVILCICLLFVCSSFSHAAESTQLSNQETHLSFGDDGTFKILTIADIQDGAFLTSLIKSSIKAAIEKEDPDLIIMPGDNIAGYLALSKNEAKKAIQQIMDILEPYHIPVAMVFGNHDDENTKLSKKEQIAVYEEYSCFVGCEGKEMEKSCGNYNIPIYESKNSDNIVYNIWMLDSGNYYIDENNNKNGYGFVYQEAIDWYVEKSNELKEANAGTPVPSMVFQHIPPVQIYDVLVPVSSDTPNAVAGNGGYWILPETAKPGSYLGESPSPANPDIPQARNEVEAMISQGDVTAIVFGHDHINSYIVPYNGIDLIATQGCTFRSYNNDNRSFRTFTLSLDDLPDYKTDTVKFKNLFSEDSDEMKLYDILSVWSGFETEIMKIFARVKILFNNFFNM